ncbi:unnamed protein product [Rotaria sp. Silwood2]|nr:unnamed protein product [Rotaria sp. Silwood2]CAF4480487.1 unnamed protein product [Rotaria sp. Silwood2]CAF4538118.1 unnamed protein product [Rotaria sp. Silwood2]
MKLKMLILKKLEKLLGIKLSRKTYLRGFINDGLDYLLDFCDKDRRKQIMLTKDDGEANVWYNEQDEDQQWLANKQRIELANQTDNIEKNIKTKKKRESLLLNLMNMFKPN